MFKVGDRVALLVGGEVEGIGERAETGDIGIITEVNWG